MSAGKIDLKSPMGLFLKHASDFAKPLAVALALILGAETACTSSSWCQDHWQIIAGGVAACLGGMTVVLCSPQNRKRLIIALITSLVLIYFCFGVAGHGASKDFSVPNDWIAQNWRPIALVGLLFAGSILLTKIAISYQKAT
jgi:hypothetical protein